MRELTLLAVPGCPLSEHARQVLDTLAAEGLLVWREVPTEAPGSERLNNGAPELLPALVNESGRMVAHGRLSERALRRSLAAGPTGDGLAAHPTTVIDMATPLPVIPADPAAASCCASSAGIDPALDAERIAALAKALAEPLRVMIVDVLRRSEEDICQCALIGLFVYQPLFSYHMKKLSDAGLVRVERRHKVGLLLRLHRHRTGAQRMAELIDRRQPRPALSDARPHTRQGAFKPRASARREMSKTGADRIVLEQALRRVPAPAAVTNALGRRCGRDGTPLHYIDDSRYVLCAIEVSGSPRCSPGRPSPPFPLEVLLRRKVDHVGADRT